MRELENLMRRLAALCPDEVIGTEVTVRPELYEADWHGDSAARTPAGVWRERSASAARPVGRRRWPARSNVTSSHFLAAHNDGSGASPMSMNKMHRRGGTSA